VEYAGRLGYRDFDCAPVDLNCNLVHWRFPGRHPPGGDVVWSNPDAKPKSRKTSIQKNFARTWRPMERLVASPYPRYWNLEHDDS
jgi:hypothetical protein